MTRIERIKNRIKSTVPCTEFLDPGLKCDEKKGTGYKCPFCGSGTKSGNASTGAIATYHENDEYTWYCFSCGKGGDVIALYEHKYGVDFNTALKELAKRYHIDTEAAKKPTEPLEHAGRETTQPKAENATDGASEADRDKLEETALQYLNECTERLEDPKALAYLSRRGISYETAHACYIGFDPKADPAESGHPAARIIIPFGGISWTGRAIDPATEKRYQKINHKGGGIGLFNQKALYDTADEEEQPSKSYVFITEGAFDALSIIEAGGAAIALNSTSNVNKLLDVLDKNTTKATLLLSLDNDIAGKKATAELATGLATRNISYNVVDICNGHKDPNEALTADRDAFVKAVNNAMNIAEKPDNVSSYINTMMGDDIEKNSRRIPTGFSNLDDISGGLNAGGLYVLAAISSLGKTTLAQQMADQIAAGGNDALYFSMEQSRLEMVSKSLARTTYQIDPKNALTSLKIRTGTRTETTTKAAKYYQYEVADRLSVIEGNFNCDIVFIGDYIRNYIRRTGTRPVVFIDYLQILQPVKTESGKTQTTKEMMDAAITALKRLCRELSVAIVVISSINRANYMNLFDFTSLKESGNIEYTADVIWGLQLQCLHSDIFNKENNLNAKREIVNEAKAAEVRKLELVCIKNRYGISSYQCYFAYRPKFDIFEVDMSPLVEVTSMPVKKQTGIRF